VTDLDGQMAPTLMLIEFAKDLFLTSDENDTNPE
jgi:hypothetical protein